MLEEDSLEYIIYMFIDLEATGSIKGSSFLGDFDGDFDDDIVFLGVINLDDFDGDIEDLLDIENIGLENLFDFLSEEPGHFDDLTEEDLNLVFGPGNKLGEA